MQQKRLEQTFKLNKSTHRRNKNSTKEKKKETLQQEKGGQSFIKNADYPGKFEPQINRVSVVEYVCPPAVFGASSITVCSLFI